MKFEYRHGNSVKILRNVIRDCQEKGHIQQVAYSTYHDGLTQVCFTCQMVRSNIIVEEENEKRK